MYSYFTIILIFIKSFFYFTKMYIREKLLKLNVLINLEDSLFIHLYLVFLHWNNCVYWQKIELSVIFIHTNLVSRCLFTLISVTAYWIPMKFCKVIVWSKLKDKIVFISISDRQYFNWVITKQNWVIYIYCLRNYSSNRYAVF